VSAQDGRFAVRDLSGHPTLEPVVELETRVGPLLAPCQDRIIAPELARFGVWEPAETRYLQATLRAGQTFVDVGANIGYFSVLAGGLVGPTGTVIAVEPEARNLDLLHRNLWRNGCTGARVIPYAAGSRPAEMSLALDEENRGAHRLVPAGHPEAGAPARCIRLDDVVPAQVDVIKVDAQGYDHDVLDGLRHTLAANPEAIVLVELSHFELGRRGLGCAEVVRRYEALDFCLAMLERDGSLRTVSAEEILAFVADPRCRDDFTLVLERCPTPPFTLASRPARVDGLSVEEISRGLMVSPPTGGRVHELNETAAVIFDLCTGERSVASIARLVGRFYELDEVPEPAVQECLDRLRRMGIVR
jgi:FkbM family methyltransferase